jgi:hypothetical protein
MPTSNTDATSSPPRLNETVGFGKAAPHLLRRSGVAPRHLSRRRRAEPSQNLSQHLHTGTKKTITPLQIEPREAIRNPPR